MLVPAACAGLEGCSSLGSRGSLFPKPFKQLPAGKGKKVAGEQQQSQGITEGICSGFPGTGSWILARCTPPTPTCGTRLCTMPRRSTSTEWYGCGARVLPGAIPPWGWGPSCRTGTCGHAPAPCAGPGSPEAGFLTLCPFFCSSTTSAVITATLTWLWP